MTFGGWFAGDFSHPGLETVRVEPEARLESVGDAPPDLVPGAVRVGVGHRVVVEPGDPHPTADFPAQPGCFREVPTGAVGGCVRLDRVVGGGVAGMRPSAAGEFLGTSRGVHGFFERLAIRREEAHASYAPIQSRNSRLAASNAKRCSGRVPIPQALPATRPGTGAASSR